MIYWSSVSVVKRVIQGYIHSCSCSDNKYSAGPHFHDTNKCMNKLTVINVESPMHSFMPCMTVHYATLVLLHGLPASNDHAVADHKKCRYRQV